MRRCLFYIVLFAAVLIFLFSSAIADAGSKSVTWRQDGPYDLWYDVWQQQEVQITSSMINGKWNKQTIIRELLIDSVADDANALGSWGNRKEGLIIKAQEVCQGDTLKEHVIWNFMPGEVNYYTWNFEESLWPQAVRSGKQLIALRNTISYSPGKIDGTFISIIEKIIPDKDTSEALRVFMILWLLALVTFLLGFRFYTLSIFAGFITFLACVFIGSVAFKGFLFICIIAGLLAASVLFFKDVNFSDPNFAKFRLRRNLVMSTSLVLLSVVFLWLVL